MKRVLAFFKKNLHIKLYFIFSIIAISVIIFEYTQTKDIFKENIFIDSKVNTLNEGWKDEKGKKIIIPWKYDIEKGKDFVITKKLTKDIGDGSYFLFYTDHTYVKVYINNKKVYQYGNIEEIPFSKTPGSGWQLIPILDTSVGDEIKIITNCPYSHYSGVLRDIYIGSKAQLDAYIINKGTLRLIVVLIPLFIGIVLLLIPLVFKREFDYKKFLEMGICFLIISIWSFTEARTWQLFFNNNYTMQTINFIAFSLVTPSLILSLNAAGFLDDSKTFRRLMFVDVIIPFVLFILQITNIADYFETLFIVHLMMFASMFVSYYIYVKGLNKIEEEKVNRRIVLVVLSAIYACGIMDMVNFYILLNRFPNGEFIRFALVVFMVAICVAGMKQAIVMNHKKIKEETLEKMAYTDELTGLYNRRAFYEKIKKLDNENLIIVYVDMNGLKWINDNRGHFMGDESIKLVASMLDKHLDDSIGSYRLGGDEFCVLCADESTDNVEKKCCEINEELSKYQNEYRHIISIAYGVVKYDINDVKTINQCITEADEIMYARKQKMHKKIDEKERKMEE